jgi:putative oxidoreductase
MKRTNDFMQLLEENKDVGLLMLRLYLGLRLASGALRRFIEDERLDEFGSLVQEAGIPSPRLVASVAFLIQLVAGLLLIIGWKTKWAALLLAPVLLFSVFLLRYYPVLHPGMPPLAALIICMVFIFVSPGRFSLEYKRKNL